MPRLLIKSLPRYECLLDASQRFPDLDPSACEAFLHLLRAGDETERLIDDHLAAHAISPGRFTVLMLLMEKSKLCPPPSTPAELAEKASVTRATMTGLIDTLERDGYVTREPDPEDRRMMSVRLTSKGEGRLKEILPGYFQRIAWLMSSLSESERKVLVRLLTKIATHAGDGAEAQDDSKTHRGPTAASA